MHSFNAAFYFCDAEDGGHHPCCHVCIQTHLQYACFKGIVQIDNIVIFLFVLASLNLKYNDEKHPSNEKLWQKFLGRAYGSQLQLHDFASLTCIVILLCAWLGRRWHFQQIMIIAVWTEHKLYDLWQFSVEEPMHDRKIDPHHTWKTVDIAHHATFCM